MTDSLDFYSILTLSLEELLQESDCIVLCCNLTSDNYHLLSDEQFKVIEAWYTVVKKAKWKNLEDVRKIYRDAEAVGNFTVFNLKGNQYRLIVGIDYVSGTVYYKYLLTHADYNKDKWKNDPYF